MIDKNELLEIFKRKLEITQKTIEDEEKQGARDLSLGRSSHSRRLS